MLRNHWKNVSVYTKLEKAFKSVPFLMISLKNFYLQLVLYFKPFHIKVFLFLQFFVEYSNALSWNGNQPEMGWLLLFFH